MPPHPTPGRAGGPEWMESASVRGRARPATGDSGPRPAVWLQLRRRGGTMRAAAGVGGERHLLSVRGGGLKREYSLRGLVAASVLLPV